MSEVVKVVEKKAIPSDAIMLYGLPDGIHGLFQQADYVKRLCKKYNELVGRNDDGTVRYIPQKIDIKEIKYKI